MSKKLSQRRLANSPAVERHYPDIDEAVAGPWVALGDPAVPIGIASTPRLRRFTALWVDELRRQWGASEA